MLNQIVMVGRFVENLKVENGKVNTKIGITRSYKNDNGEYETDFIPIELNDSLATNTAEYCSKGDLVGVKGRLQETDNGLVVVAEKITFLSNKNESKDSE